MPSGSRRDGSIVVVQLADDARVISWIHDNDHVQVILGSGANQGGTTDVYIFNGNFERDVWVGNDPFKWIEIDDDQVDWYKIVLLHLALVTGFTASRKDAAVNFWM